MNDYRWPGYAIQDGVLYEAAGCTRPFPGDSDSVQRWRKIQRLSAPSLLALLRQLEAGVSCRFSSKPSDGVILEESDER